MPDNDTGSGFDPSKLHPMFWLKWVFTFEWIAKQWEKIFKKGAKK